MSALIDPNTRWWNFPLIQSIFTPEEASRISSLALSPTGTHDTLIWIGTTNGLYFVRSAYHLAKARDLRQKGECSTGTQAQQVWQKVWSLQVPGVVRTFLWRVCNEALPTRVNLFHRKIVPDPLCPICGQCPETSVLILWECDSATAVWRECSRKIQKLSIVASDGYSLFAKLMAVLDDAELAKVIFLARRIWL